MTHTYPVHEKVLLSIVKAPAKWQFDLLGSHFKVYTDYCTLESFLTQWDFVEKAGLLAGVFVAI